MSCFSFCEKDHPTPLPLYRSITGTGNNADHPGWGATGATLLRLSPATYADGKGVMIGQSTPREISNALCVQNNDDPVKFTQLLTVWGQFLDHELDLTVTGSEGASMVTPNDPCPPPAKFEGCEKWPGRTIPFTRAKFHLDKDGVRQYANEITSFIDASNVYGSTPDRADYLRKKDGSGKLKFSEHDGAHYLPYNKDELPNESLPGQDPKTMYLAGDVRANENALLTAMHTLFMREHNLRCDEIKKEFPELDGENLYQKARAWVAALMQVITYKEFLPILMGRHAPKCVPYDEKINPGIAIEFAGAAYRFGHSLVSQTVPITEDHGTLTLQLTDCFFQPSLISKYGIDGFLFGARTHAMQKLDLKIVPALRSFLFESPSIEFLHDLASLNLQRGRDEGISKYNAVRTAYGLPCKKVWHEVTKCVETQERLKTVFTSPSDMDLWVGCLAEDPVYGMCGELLHAVLFDQFSRLQRGDRYWHTRDPSLSEKEKYLLSKMTLGDVICRNTSLKPVKTGHNVFLEQETSWCMKFCHS